MGAKMAKMNVSDLGEADLKGKIVFVGVDLNELLDYNLKTTDVTSVDTIKSVMSWGAKVILPGHLGHGKRVTPNGSLESLLPRIDELLDTKVQTAKGCCGEEVANLVAAIPERGVLILENVKKLDSLADLYVDAFGTAHRAHPSTKRATKYLKSFIEKYALKAFCCWLPGALVPLVVDDEA